MNDNDNDKLSSLDHATVEDLMTADFGTDDATVEQHLTEMKATYAALATDPETDMRIDAAIAAADDELGLDDSTLFLADPHQPTPTRLRDSSRLRDLSSSEPGREEDLELTSPARDRSDLRRPPFLVRLPTFAYLTVVTMMMLTAVVLLGIFGNADTTHLILPTLTASTSAVVVAETALRAYLSRRSVHESGAYKTLELILSMRRDSQDRQLMPTRQHPELQQLARDRELRAREHELRAREHELRARDREIRRLLRDLQPRESSERTSTTR